MSTTLLVSDFMFSLKDNACNSPTIKGWEQGNHKFRASLSKEGEGKEKRKERQDLGACAKP